MRTIDFAIITGLLEEFEVLKDAIPGLQEEPDERQGDVWYRGRIDSKGDYGYAVVAAFQQEMGPLSANLLTQRLIDRWDPAYIILLGIAGSFSKDVRLGDLIVSQQVFYYGPGKAQGKGIKYRPEGYPCSVVLIRQIQALTIDRRAIADLRAEARASALQKAKAASENPKAGDLDLLRKHVPKIHFGTVASGALVVASKAKQRELLALHGKILGTEMESAGVLHAAFFSGDTPTPAIMIKGISDHSNHLKSHQDEKDYWRKLATENSVRLALALIKSGRIHPLHTDEFTVDVARSSVAEVRNRIKDTAALGVSFLGFPKLVSPKGPLTKLSIKILAFDSGGQSLRLVDGIAEYVNMRNEQIRTNFPKNLPEITCGQIGPEPVGIYFMLSGTAARIQFQIKGPAAEQEVALELKSGSE